MVVAYHVIFGAYGFWLPNDPRGSWSEFVWAWELRRFGEATKVHVRRSVAGRRHDVGLRREAKLALKYPAVALDGRQAVSAGRGLARAAEESGYSVYACSILPEHVHLVVGRHHYEVEQVVRVMKQAATEELARDGRHPLGKFVDGEGRVPTPWARKCWHVFLEDARDVERAVRYVENNPVKEGLARQRWQCVVPWESVDLRSTAKRAIERGRWV
jgi:REP element-mobilizing transposase RayT